MQEEKSVLRERAGIFAIYLVVLFINAFVDLGHKIIIQNTIFMIYGEQTQLILTAIVNAMILVPFILLFTLSGHLSDKFAKPSYNALERFCSCFNHTGDYLLLLSGSL